MAKARIFHPFNTLAKILGSSTAPTADELMVAAQANVETLADDLRAYVENECTELLAKAARPGEEQSLSQTALNIAEVAGSAGLAAMGEVARGIRAMIVSRAEGHGWDNQAFQLHLVTLARFRAGSGDMTPENAELLKGLEAVRHKIGVPE